MANGREGIIAFLTLPAGILMGSSGDRNFHVTRQQFFGGALDLFNLVEPRSQI
jgi:hypothetical protein